MESHPLGASGLAELSGLGGLLLVPVLILPVLGLLFSLAVGGRHLGRLALGLVLAGVAAALAIAAVVLTGDEPLTYALGAWPPPLGVTLKADGLSAVMLLLTSVLMLAVGIYAQGEFRPPPGTLETRTSLAFWILLFGVWAGLNLVFLAQDLFTLFVALELLTFSAVPLVCLDGRAETLAAALRYLLFALMGSALYLLGTVLIYGTYGALDIGVLATRLAQTDTVPSAMPVAIALMTTGLLAKTALFPLHLWLPPAHSGAPPAASAVLSALVVKGSFFLILRLWFDLAPGLLDSTAVQILGGLGAAAILVGNLVALGQVRLKLLVAYSTVAQIGYLFLIFPLAATALGPTWALSGGTLQVVSHALAKGSLFLAAGLIYGALGHDRIRGLAGVGRALPITVLAIALAGLSLVGVPPSGGYQVKAVLKGAAEADGAWWWGLVLDAGGLLTTAYLAWVLGHALSRARGPVTLAKSPRLSQELVVLGLALAAFLLGLLSPGAFDLIGIGRTLGPEPIASAWTRDSDWASIGAELLPVLAVVALVLLLGPWGEGRRSGPRAWVRPGISAIGAGTAGLDAGLRRWPVAGLSLLVSTLALATSFFTGQT
jgi:formate hydrogenlyase subunit 3/multisubunit Na+/H+ antiporter MnhD subunit